MTSSEAATVFTTCRYCESACALAVEVEGNRVRRVRADELAPGTWRDACAKGLTAHELVEHPRRITAPMKRVGDRFVEASYDEAIAAIAAGFGELIDRHGPDSVGYYHGNPLGFTSGIMFSLGFVDALGTRNRYNVGSVDQNNNHVVSDALFGLPYVPFSSDLDACDYMLLIGMNPAESRFGWLGGATDGWRRARQRQAEGARIVVVDPRRTATARHADLHLAPVPGTDWAFLLGLLHVVFREELQDDAACRELPEAELARLRALAAGADPASLAARCGIAADDIVRVAREYASARSGICLTQTGVSMHTTGTVGHWLGLALDLVTGHLDRPGGRRFDTGYINMTRFAASSRAPASTSRVRGQPTVLGFRSLAELPDEILTPGDGRIRGMLIHCGNPVISGPDGPRLDRALAELDLLVAVDLVQRESHRHADWLIPGQHWLEREELVFSLAGGMDEPVAQYSRKALEAPPGVRPEWELFVDLALAMGRPFMGRRGANTMIRLTRLAARAFSRPQWAFSPATLERLLLASGRSVAWRDLLGAPHGIRYRDKRYGLLREEMKGRPIHVAPEAFCEELSRLLEAPSPADDGHPYTVIGKRTLHMMNSWLMELPNMQRRQQANDCEINPSDARALGIADGADVEVSSAVGRIVLPARLSDDVPPGVVSIQHGWGSRVFDPRGGAEPLRFGVNVNELVDGAVVDPFSGTPNLNSTRVRLAPA